MSQNLSQSANRVQDALRAASVECLVKELPASTRSAAEAADAIGCEVAQIAKSLIFRGQTSNTAILAIVSGTNRVNEKSFANAVGEPLGKADADFVRVETGFAIGGIPPLGHDKHISTFIDEDLFQYEEIWAAAGTPHAVFRTNPVELQKITGARVVKVS